MMRRKIIIAIDGYSSTGKSTFAKKIAKMLDYIYVDTGAMYRAVALYCLNEGLVKENEPSSVKAAELEKAISEGKIEIGFIRSDKGNNEILTVLNGKNVEKEIRTMAVSSVVSGVATIAPVRDFVNRSLREFGKDKGIVMDGRDIGSTVFPNAELKIFMTAAPEIRAGRRLKELKEKGDTTTTFEQVLENIKQRDFIDSTRKVSPLVKADDALVLDNSTMTMDDQIEWIKSILK